MEQPRYQPCLGNRDLFPDLRARAYLNHAAISPPSVAVKDAVNAAIGDFQRHGVDAFSRWADRKIELKTRLARFIGATGGDEIAFVPNTSSGVLAIALCFPWKRGDRVVVFDGEFPTNVTPWQRAAQLYELEVIRLSLEPISAEGGPDLTHLEAALRNGVRLVAFSAVQFQTGLRMPMSGIVSLCRRYGAEVFVDGIQAVGVLPIDVDSSGIDYMSVGAHKWLMGLEGTAFLYARKERQEHLRPIMASWLSHEEPLKFLFEGSGHLDYDRPIRKSIDFLEFGAGNTIGLAGFEASLGLLEHLGVAQISDHVTTYLERLEQVLTGHGFVSMRSPIQSLQSAILSVRPPAGKSSAEWAASFSGAGFAVTQPDGYLRFAPHWPNHVNEVGLLAHLLDNTDQL
jgi:cysteine desulfurase/selenocysteine lyase